MISEEIHSFLRAIDDELARHAAEGETLDLHTSRGEIRKRFQPRSREITWSSPIPRYNPSSCDLRGPRST